MRSARMASFRFAGVLVALLCVSALAEKALAEEEIAPAPVDATAIELLQGALELTRGASSYTRLAMKIHRPDWERNMELEAWTQGQEDALIRFTAPAKDAGNATLKLADSMWTFVPQLKREARLPSSMMSASWASSDFSYNDLSRSDNYLRYYAVEIVDRDQEGGHTVFSLQMTPYDDAPIVWGRETMVLRDDYVMLSQTFHDQDLIALKQMETRDIGPLGGREIPLVMRMSDLAEPDHWTEIRYLEADFDANVPAAKFTRFALRGER